MAVFIVAIASAMALVVLSGAARSALGTKQGDVGLVVASDALESASVYDCGTTTSMLASGAGDVSTPGDPVPGVLASRLARCVPASKGAVGDLGDVRWRQTEGAIAYDVTVRTNWVVFRPRADVTTADGGLSAAAARAYFRLRRDVTVTWRASGRTRRRTLAQLVAPPPDAIARSNRGTLTLTGVPVGAGGPGSATLDLGHGFTVTHSADDRGVVRFPYLELGVSYPLLVNGSPRAPVTPTERIPDVVQAG